MLLLLSIVNGATITYHTEMNLAGGLKRPATFHVVIVERVNVNNKSCARTESVYAAG